MFYWFLKHILLGPLLRVLYRTKVTGLENIPAEGGAILAANHLSFVDSLFIPLSTKRKVVYLGKSDYFDSWRTRWFFKNVGVIPVRREGGSAGEASLRAGIEQLEQGMVVGIYPEGTRSPDGRLYRGKTGIARMAIEAGVPIIPVAVAGTPEIMPIDRKMPKLRGRITIEFGKPLGFERYREQEADRFVYRSITDEVMYEIMMLTGQEYVDEYASKVKKQLAAAKEGDGDGGKPDEVVEVPEAETDRSS